MTPAKAFNTWRLKQALLLVILLLLTPLSSLAINSDVEDKLDEKYIAESTPSPWNSQLQPWGQYSGVPTHNGTMPPHGPMVDRVVAVSKMSQNLALYTRQLSIGLLPMISTVLTLMDL